MKKMFSYDRFPQGRKKLSIRVEINCVNCKTTQFEYQKENNGPIDKVFFDSIHDKPEVKNSKEFRCVNCEKLLGNRFVFGPERRLAFRMYPGSIYFKVIKPPKPPTRKISSHSKFVKA
jgi:hypothetical protein